MIFNNSTELLKTSVTKQILCNIHCFTLIPVLHSFGTPIIIAMLWFEKFATHYNTRHNSLGGFYFAYDLSFLNVANPVFNKVYGFDIFRFAMHCFAMSITLVPPILLTNVCETRLNICVASPDRFALQPWVRWVAHILKLSMVLSRYIFQNWKCFKTECYYDHCCMT